MDFLRVTEHDLLEVGDFAVFGSDVTILCSDDNGARPVVVGKGGNVLDRSTLCPGVRVGDLAVLGTETFGYANRYRRWLIALAFLRSVGSRFLIISTSIFATNGSFCNI